MLVPKFKGIDSVNVFDCRGGTGVAEGNAKFQQDVKHLLETPLGSVLGNLKYGSLLYQYIFLPVQESTGTLIQNEIKKRIEDNYSDIVIDTVDVTLSRRKINVSIGMNNGNSNVVEYIDLDFSTVDGGDLNG